MISPQPTVGSTPIVFTKSVAVSYGIVAGILLLAAWLHMGTLLVTVLFSLFTLKKLLFFKQKWLAVTLFIVLVVAALYGFGFFLHKAAKDLPKIMEDAIPQVVTFAEDHEVNLPFSDWDDLKDYALQKANESRGYLGNFAKLAGKELVMLLAGIVIAIGIFVNSKHKPVEPNLYTENVIALKSRFKSLFQSFESVMGAQLIISVINTIATACFLLSTGLRTYAGIVIPLTFICGMLPIVGNLISNVFIVGIALGLLKSPQLAIASLVFLVIVHKAEYLFNSKIIGSRIRHPMWLTLIGLILGEYIMGIPGVILAPVILNYLKVEGSRYAPPELTY